MPDKDLFEDTTLAEPGGDSAHSQAVKPTPTDTPGSASAAADGAQGDPATPSCRGHETKRGARKRRKGVGDAAVTGSAHSPGEPVRPSACPRWMHHRSGVYCKACGRTP